MRTAARILLQLLVLLGLGGSVGTSWAAEAAEPRQPNIVYILLDDAGYGDLSCYGQKKFQTPNIDRLAQEGMQFTQHYSGSTVCAPTRCVLMTGRHTGHSFIRGNREVRPEGQAAIPSQIVTLPERLQQAGYVTGAFGKWGLGSPGSEGDPVKQGFQTFYGYNCQREAHTYYPKHLWNNRQKVPLDGKTYSHDLIMDQALKFIRQNQGKRFFCFLPVTIPHAAMHVPAQYSARFREQFAQFENKIGKYRGPQVKNPIAAFAGMMTKLDEDVGRLLDLLRELEIDQDTLVMLSSDNGPHLEGGHDPRFFDSNGPFRGFKRDLYEGGIRVPLLARWPATIKSGSRSELVCAHWDMLPTFCELAGAAPGENIDGISLVPTLMGGPQQQKHDFLYWEFYAQGGKRAARFGPWKAVQLGLHRDADGPVELFNLQDDPGERKNIASDHPELVNKARQIFAAAHEPSTLWRFRSFEKPSQSAAK